MMFWNFAKNKKNEEEIDLRIDGDIVADGDTWFYDWFGEPSTSPNKFRKALAEYKGKSINVWIDSYGGDVLAAAGIYNALKEHKGKVRVKIDGKAMSAGSIIAMAGDEILMSPLSMMMIHNPWSGASGEAKDFIHQAKVLGEVKETLLNAYQSKTGIDRNKISEMMDNETWMSAKTAVAEGFADGILYEDEEEEKKTNNFMYSRFAVQNNTSKNMERFFELYNEKFKKEDTGETLVDLYSKQNKIIERMKQL